MVGMLSVNCVKYVIGDSVRLILCMLMLVVSNLLIIVILIEDE